MKLIIILSLVISIKDLYIYCYMVSVLKFIIKMHYCFWQISRKLTILFPIIICIIDYNMYNCIIKIVVSFHNLDMLIIYYVYDCFI